MGKSKVDKAASEFDRFMAGMRAITSLSPEEAEEIRKSTKRPAQKNKRERRSARTR